MALRDYRSQQAVLHFDLIRTCSNLDVLCMLGRASYMSRTSAFKIKVAADCSNQRKVGAALATGWIFFSSVPQFKELSFCFLSGIAMGSWYIA